MKIFEHPIFIKLHTYQYYTVLWKIGKIRMQKHTVINLVLQIGSPCELGQMTPLCTYELAYIVREICTCILRW